MRVFANSVGLVLFRKTRRVTQFCKLLGPRDLLAGPGEQANPGRSCAFLPRLLLRYPQVRGIGPVCSGLRVQGAKPKPADCRSNSLLTSSASIRWRLASIAVCALWPGLVWWTVTRRGIIDMTQRVRFVGSNVVPDVPLCASRIGRARQSFAESRPFRDIAQQAANAAQGHQRVAMLHHLDRAVLLSGQPRQLFLDVDGLHRRFAALGAGGRLVGLDANGTAGGAAPAVLEHVIPGDQENIHPALAQGFEAARRTRRREPLGTDALHESRRDRLRFLLLPLDERRQRCGHDIALGMAACRRDGIHQFRGKGFGQRAPYLSRSHAARPRESGRYGRPVP